MKQLTVKTGLLFSVTLMLAFWGMVLQTYAATTVPNTFSSGTTINSSQMNANFGALATAIDKNAAGTQFINNSTANTSLADNNVHNVASVTITCPDAGYVLLMVGGYAVFFGDNTMIDVGIGTSSTAMDAYYTRLGRQDGSGTLRYTYPIGYTVIKPVSAAGTYTFYLNAQRESVFSTNSVNVSPVTFSAIYIRNTY